MLTEAEQRSDQDHRRILLNLKCLFWCLHELRQHYNMNLALHSLERREVHPDIRNTHLGDNLEYLIGCFDETDLRSVQSAIHHLGESRASMSVEGKHFEVGHYIQAISDFGPIARGSNGVIASITPQLRGLFHLDGGHLIETEFAPSKVGVIFGTYID